MVSVDPTDVAVFIITFTKKHGRTPLVGEILRVQQETENVHIEIVDDRGPRT